MNINLFQLIILLALASNLAIGIIVLATRSKRSANLAFLCLNVNLTVWLCCMAMGAFSTRVEQVEFWIRQSSWASSCVPLMMTVLRLSLVSPHDPLPKLFRRAYPWAIGPLLILGLVQTSFFMESASLPPPEFSVAQPHYGPGFIPFALYFIMALLFLVVMFVRNARQAEGILLLELKFILLGCVAGLCFGVFFLIVPNVAGMAEIGVFLPLAPIILAGFMAYGIAARRIMDIPNVLRRILAYTLILVYLIVLYLFVWYACETLISGKILDVVPLQHVLPAVVLALSLRSVRGRMQRVVNHLFHEGHSLDPVHVMRATSRALSSLSTMDELVNAVRRILSEQLGARSAQILTRAQDGYSERSPEGPRTSLQLTVDDPLVALLRSRQEALVRAVLDRGRVTPQIQAAAIRMRELGVELAMGVYAGDALQGILLLGPRESGGIYGLFEQRLMEGLSSQLSVSLRNAQLYTQVQNSRAYNEMLLDRMTGGVIAVDAEGRINVFNREAQRVTGLSRETMLQAPLHRLPKALSAPLEKALHRVGSRDLESLLETDDREIPIRYSCAPFHGHVGQALGALLVFNDQTQLKRLEREIRRTDRLASLGTLAAGMAHEIKNPLVAMKTFTQLLPERYDDPDFRETSSTLLADEVGRIDRIVNQLLRFARPAKPSLAPVHIHAIANTTINLVQQQFRRHRVDIIRQYEAQHDLIHGDADMLVQALLNFMLNALDALGDDGQLTVRTENIQVPTQELDLWGQAVTKWRLRVSVIDTGVGIAPEDLGHVFDPFYTTKASGTGLGLSVSHGIVAEHHGAIEVQSEPGRGTTFQLTFPLLEDAVLG